MNSPSSASRMSPKPVWVKSVVKMSKIQKPRGATTVTDRAISYIQYFKDQVEEAMENKASILESIASEKNGESRGKAVLNGSGGEFMNDTFISKMPTGDEVGMYFAVLWSRDGIRTIRGDLLGRGRIRIEALSEPSRQSERSLEAANCATFFRRAAETMGRNLPANATMLPVAVVASLPICNTSVKSAMVYSPEHPINGLDISTVLDLALEDCLLPVKCVGVCNDAVASLLASWYQCNAVDNTGIQHEDENHCPPQRHEGLRHAGQRTPRSQHQGEYGARGADIAVLIDPGFNVSLKDENHNTRGCIINTEIGRYLIDDRYLTDLDYIEAFETNPKCARATLEHMIVHIGEVFRLAIRFVWQENSPIAVRRRGVISNKEALKMASETSNFEYIGNFCVKRLHWETTKTDRKLLQSLALGVAQRSAAYFSCTLVALLSYLQLEGQLNRQIYVTVDSQWDGWWLNFVNHLLSRTSYFRQSIGGGKLRLHQVTDSVRKGAVVFAARRDITVSSI